SIVLDIDLDYFTYSIDGYYPRHPDDILKQLNSNFFERIFNKSKIVTIALEPECCGGPEYSKEIFKVLNEELLKSQSLNITEDDINELLSG
ncbi:MAG: hypothetical protein ACOC5T_10310, partial [Elusimicrobiota bacterium]